MNRKRGLRILLTAILSFAMVFGTIPFSFAESGSNATIKVDNVTASAGSTVVVNVNIQDNPGILGTTMTLDYDPELTLTDASAGDAFSALSMTKPGKYEPGCNFIWDGQDLDAKDIKDGTILSLVFDVPGNAENGKKYDINMIVQEAVDPGLGPVDIDVVNGSITVSSYLVGDLNGDKKYTSSDVIMMRRGIAGGYGIELDPSVADVNGSGSITSADVIILRRFIAGGYDIDILPHGGQTTNPGTHVHTLNHYDAVAATCTEAGSHEYWQCSDCSRYYSDAKALNEIQEADLVIPAKGHTVVADPAVAPTTTSTGLTEGSHCSVCDTVLVEQKVIPKLEGEQYSITYHLYGNDTYLQQQDINIPTPDYYISENGLRFTQFPKCDGYVFEGWFDMPGSYGQIVREIPEGTTGDIDLYAKWTLADPYKISFDSSVAPVDSIYYTVNQGATLINPDWFGYTFAGWTDDDGNLVRRIPVGTTGDITLTASWTSQRNQTRPAKSHPAIITEDEENGIYFFTYHIGRIENIPLYTIKEFPNKMGLTFEEVYTKEDAVTDTTAQSLMETVSKTTTKSSSWTLSKEWDKSTTVSESHLSEIGKTLSEAEDISRTKSGKYSIGLNLGGSNSTTTEDGVSTKTGWGVNGKVNGEYSSKAGVSVPLKGVSVSAEKGWKLGAEIGAHYDKETTTSHKDIKTKESNWNINSGYEAAQSATYSHSLSSTLSSKIADEYGYSSTVHQGGSQSETESYLESGTEGREYGQSISFSNAKKEITTTKVTNADAPVGYYRLVAAGTAEVFAVVGYDVATSTYFTNSYSLVTGARKEFVDYSKDTSGFDDNENGVLPFEVPYEVREYVDQRATETAGLQVDIETGILERYTGTDRDVVVPEFMAVDNGDGTTEVVKVKGFKSSVFQGKDIKSIKFGKYVTSIPENAFKNCTSLEEIDCSGVTSIGAGAFSGCTSLTEFLIPTQITQLGTGAFQGVDTIKVKAINENVAEGAITSGAKNITLTNESGNSFLNNKTIGIPNGTESFQFNGMNKTYTNLRIISDAAKTEINGLDIQTTKGVPLKISSGDVVLNRVNVQAPDLAAIFSADQIDLGLYGNVKLISGGTNAVLTKDTALSIAKENAVGKLVVTGNVLVCDEFTDNGLLEFTDPSYKVVVISAATFDQLAQGSLEWVLESEAPANATIVNQKWTYDKKTYLDSSNSYVEGYSLISSDYTWSAYGSWSSWSNTKATASDSRQVETRNIAAQYKTQYNYSRWASASNNTGHLGPWKGTWGGVYCGYYFERGWTDSALQATSSQTAGGTTFYLYGGNTNSWFNQTTRQVVTQAAYTQYRYRDRSKIWTYHHMKLEPMESTTSVTASDTITNVQKWVQYVMP